MEDQEIFDKVINHLRKQNSRSTSEEIGGFAYRGDNGKKCAIGILIEDEEYSPKMELKSIYEPEFKVFRQRYKNNLCLLGDLQKIHDETVPMNERAILVLWEIEFQNLAKKYDLKYSST